MLNKNIHDLLALVNRAVIGLICTNPLRTQTGTSLAKF